MVSLRSRCSRNLGTHMHKKWCCLARVTDFLSCISYFSCSSHVASLVRLTLVNNISQSSPINLGSFIYRWINNYNWSLIKNPKQHLSNRSDLSVGSVWLFVRINKIMKSQPIAKFSFIHASTLTITRKLQHWFCLTL